MDGGNQGGHPAGGEKDHRDAEPRFASRGQGDVGGEPDHVLWRSNLGADHERQYKRYGVTQARPGTEPLAVVRPLHGDIVTSTT